MIFEVIEVFALSPVIGKIIEETEKPAVGLDPMGKFYFHPATLAALIWPVDTGRFVAEGQISGD